MRTDDRFAIAACLLLCFTLPLSGATVPEGDILKTLKKGHPRLLLTDQGLKELQDNSARFPELKSMTDRIIEEARGVLSAPPVERKLEEARLLLLGQSRSCVLRMYQLGLAYRLTGEKVFADRARQELLAVSDFQDWNPSHFLDTAEMSHAMGIGYDWFYDELGEDRDKIREALIEKGLKSSFEGITYWKKCNHNWNFVCHGGLGIGALAIADEWPEGAARVLSSAIEGIPYALKSYAPDGGWAEGPGYWHYASSYLCYFLAAMDTALGEDFGLSEAEGLADTGLFRIQFIAPTGLSFNYADSGPGCGPAEEMFWLSRRFKQPLYAWHEMTKYGQASPTPWHAIWFDPDTSQGRSQTMPKAQLFKGVHVAFFKSSWEDPKALFVGFKGGDNRANHSHLDLGTFVLDALGERWAMDLGRDSYDLPGYFGGYRWTYYRLKTEGQNTLTLGQENQKYHAEAPIVTFKDQGNPCAVADLTEAYVEQAHQVKRGIRLLEDKSVLVQDELTLSASAEILWSMHTQAQIQCEGRQATLRIGEKSLKASLLAPEGAVFESGPAAADPPQDPNTGIFKLMVRLRGEADSPITICVQLTPQTEVPGPSAAPSSLNDW